MHGDDVRRFEALEAGEEHDCGSIAVERGEMLEFAERYDPQPFHVDPDAAEESMYGELIASGWFTCALTARRVVEGFWNETATLGGTGMDVRWHAPVYAGDTLHVTVEVEEKRAGDDPSYGLVEAHVATENQHGVEVLTMDGFGLVEKRNPS